MNELRALPDRFADTVSALHRVAEQIVAPARKPDNEIALEATPGGFGTPVFEHDGASHRVRVEGAELIHAEDGAEQRAPLASLAAAGEAVEELLPAEAELDTAPLAVDAAASRSLADFYAFAAAQLDRLIGEAVPADEATPPTLWPEHFDLAIELGEEGAGERANYGASPGDENHPEPYLYVGPWSGAVEGGLWRASGFTGAELGYAELIAAPDQAAMAMDFFRSRRDDLKASARRAK